MSNKLVVAVGDIHGCLEEFDELLKKIQYNKEQMRLVLLGDLMDRGPDPVGCVRRARELGVECIMGNHEEKHLRWHKHEKKRLDTGKPNPMKRMAPAESEANDSLSDQDWTWLKALPLKLYLGEIQRPYAVENWWAIHGGCEPRYSLENQNEKQVIRCRYVDQNGIAKALNPDKSQPEGTVYWTEAWRGPESIVYGHCVHDLEKPRYDVCGDAQCVGIDTGCCFGGHLTAMIMNPEPGHFTYPKVKAKKKYYEGYGDE
jgi:bis(5'-nucleosyl)-tetraphosphatase (symmetrical)